MRTPKLLPEMGYGGNEMSQSSAGFARLFKARIFKNVPETRTVQVYKIESRNESSFANGKMAGTS